MSIMLTKCKYHLHMYLMNLDENLYLDSFVLAEQFSLHQQVTGKIYITCTSTTKCISKKGNEHWTL
jgi:hypothetical protein